MQRLRDPIRVLVTRDLRESEHLVDVVPDGTARFEVADKAGTVTGEMIAQML